MSETISETGYSFNELGLVNNLGEINKSIKQIANAIEEIDTKMNAITDGEWMGLQKDTIIPNFQEQNAIYLSSARSMAAFGKQINSAIEIYNNADKNIATLISSINVVSGANSPILAGESVKNLPSAALSIEYGINTSSFSDESGKKINLWEFVPEGLTSNSALAVYIPGSGENGTNVNLVERTSLPYLIKNGNITPDTIVLTLQAPGKGNYTEIYKAAIDEVVKKHQIDPSKISISGHSRGGIATYDMIAAYPNYFSSAAIISGYASGSTQSKLKASGTTTNIYAYHGTNDSSVKYSAGAQTARVLNNAGINVTFTELKGSGHSIQNNVYLNEGYDILHHLFITT